MYLVEDHTILISNGTRSTSKSKMVKILSITDPHEAKTMKIFFKSPQTLKQWKLSF